MTLQATQFIRDYKRRD